MRTNFLKSLIFNHLKISKAILQCSYARFRLPALFSKMGAKIGIMSKTK